MLRRQAELPWTGFHSGQFGTAAALAEAAAVAHDGQLADYAMTSLDRAIGAVDGESTEWDIIAGISGSIVALAAASNLLGRDEDDLTDILRARLAEMCEPDVRTGGVRWPSRARRTRALAGLAHGGTGAALALVCGPKPAPAWAFDLATRSVRFEDLARTDATNWLDYRTYPLASGASAWCHGAGGIGLGTLGILDNVRRQTADSSWILDLEARVATAAMRTRSALETMEFDDGLCHGASGRALAVLVMTTALGEPCDAAELLNRLAVMRERPLVRDFSLMKGESGRVLTRLAIAGLADPPIALTLLPRSGTERS